MNEFLMKFQSLCASVSKRVFAGNHKFVPPKCLFSWKSNRFLLKDFARLLSECSFVPEWCQSNLEPACRH